MNDNIVRFRKHINLDQFSNELRASEVWDRNHWQEYHARRDQLLNQYRPLVQDFARRALRHAECLTPSQVEFLKGIVRGKADWKLRDFHFLRGGNFGFASAFGRAFGSRAFEASNTELAERFERIWARIKD